MNKLLEEFKYDLAFIISHTLQPKWFKILKVFILLGVLVGYYALFGFKKTVVFFGVFFFLSAILHLIYRSKTNRWMQSWLDFVVYEEDGQQKTQRIGIYYYAAIATNAILSLVISQVLI